MNLFFKKMSVFLVLFVFLISCVDSDKNSLPQEDSVLDRVKMENGYLSFQNLEDFAEVKTLLQKKDSKFLDEWESKIGFQSFRSIYETAMQQNEIGSNAELNKLLASEDPLDINLPNFEIARVVNQDRVLKIGSKYFSYSKDNVKIITDNDESKLNELDKYSKSDLANGVFVTEVKHLSNDDLQGKTEATLSSCNSVSLTENYAIALIENYTQFIDDTGNAHRTYQMLLGSATKKNPKFLTSAELKIYGCIETNLWNSRTSYCTDQLVYNSSTLYVTLFDVVQPIASYPDVQFYRHTWTGYGTYTNSTIQCNIFYTTN